MDVKEDPEEKRIAGVHSKDKPSSIGFQKESDPGYIFFPSESENRRNRVDLDLVVSASGIKASYVF